MLVENHKIRLRESLELIEYCVRAGAVSHQRTLGFHLSAAAVDLLNIHLHQVGFTTTSADINHRWLRSEKKTDEKIPHTFPLRDRILELLMQIEEMRDPLCYGVPRSEPEVEAVILTFQELRKIFRGLGTDEA